MKVTSTKIKSPAKAKVKENSFPIVAIGASAGGLEAMMELLEYLPADTGMAFIYVQHLSPDHKSKLTEILSSKTRMKVHEIDDMDKIEPNNIFVIPYNKGIEVKDGHLKLIPRSESGASISIDTLFSSLAHAQKERVIGIILSGSASDGTVGMKDIKLEGGLTFAQDDTAKFTSMPHAAIAVGAVDFILSPKEIALELARLSKHPLIKTIRVKNGEEDLIDNRNPDLKNILNQLHKVTGVDFSAYKMSTIKRRIIRRMLLYKITVLKEYAKLLSQKREEIEILYQDLLINVTSFFRDTDTHKYLEENLFPKLLTSKKTGESLRLWVAACATGEEAYSIAMVLLEIQESKTTSTPVQIFATDLSEQAIRKARLGIYTQQELETVTPKRIQRFFSKANGGFRINKAVRDMCVFAPHNILQDPPFSRLDFISCCNLFIYLDNAAQKKAVNTFHYALKDDGFLMLGKSENITQSANLFTGVNTKYKIFSPKKTSGSRPLPALLPRYTSQAIPEKNLPLLNRNKTKQIISVNHNALDNAIDALLIAEYMPASVVINHQMEIVQFRGSTGLFLTHPQGKATFNIVKMARPEFAFELRNSISKVIKTNHRLRKSGVEMKINEAVKNISFEIIPLKLESDEPLLLILFTEQEQAEIYSSKPPSRGQGASLAKDRRIKKLEEELAEARLDALAFAQDQEAFTEELQSANEEVVSSNEELQTVNEELGTSKEETESANEELTVTNQELQTRNDQLNQSYNYSEAIIATMHNPMVVLDKSLRVKSASKIFYKKFEVTEAETEGVLLFDLGNGQWNIPRLRDRIEDILTNNSHFYDFEITHTFPLIGERIMLLNASRIVHKINQEELILLAFADVTEVRKHALEKSVKEKEALEFQIEAQTKLVKLRTELEGNVRRLFMEAPALICVYRGPQHVYELANEMYLQLIGKRDILGKPLREALPELEGQGFFEILDNVYSTGEPFIGNEVVAQLDKGNGKLEDAYFNFVYQPAHNSEGEIDGILVHGVDVTEQVLARKKVEDSEKRYSTMLKQSPFAFAILKGKDMVVAIANDSIKQMWGKGNTIEGKPLIEILPEIKDQEFPALLQKVYTTGIPYLANEALARVKRKGKMEDAYFNFVYQPYRETDGTILGITIIAIEVTNEVIAKKKIKANEEQLQNILLQAPAAIAVFDGPQHRFIMANQAYQKQNNRKEKDFLGKSIREVFPELEGTGSFEIFDSVYTTGETFTASEYVATIDSDNNGIPKQRYFNFSLEALKNESKEIYGVMVMAYDITEQVEAKKIIEESDKRYNRILMQSPFAFSIMKGKDKVITHANDLMKDFWGKGNDVEGKTLLEVLPELRDQPFPQMFDSVYTTGQPISANEILARLNRHGIIEEHYFNLTYQPSFETDGTISGVITIAHEVTEQVLVRKKIEESEVKYRYLFNSIDAGFCIIEVLFNENEMPYDYRFLEANNAFEKQTGLIDAVGKTIKEMVHGHEQYWFDIYGRIAKTGKSERFENEAKALGIYYEVYAFLVGEPKENRVGVIFNDITERKQAEEKLKESENLFRTMADASPLLIWTLDAKGLSSYYNKTFLDFIGASKDEDITDWEKIVHPDDVQSTFDTINTANAEHRSYSLECRILRVDGHWRWVLAQGSPRMGVNNEFLGFVGSSVDITERKEAEEKIIESEKQLRELSTILEQKVQQRTIQLEEKNKELQNMNKELETFAYVSSHDMQEPLRKIQTLVGRILDKEDQNLSDNGKNYFRLMQNAAQRMQTLIVDLLAFSKLSIADRKFETIDLNIIIEEAKIDFKDAIAEKHAVITVEEICDVKIIPFQFRQLMRNLIGNALKFSKPDSAPHILIKSEILASYPPLEGRDACHISITDNGIGFENIYAEKIFEVFQRLHNREEYAGTGIGLAIVKKIVENHNGIITTTSELTKGTTFHIYIPA